MNDPDAERRYKERNSPPSTVPIKITREEAPYLFNVLCDNARAWNKRLRVELAQVVTPTDAHNARSVLLGRAEEGTNEPV